MNIVRGRADAHWLPARYNFAIFRLYGLVRMRFAKAAPADVAMVVDRHQSAIENFTVGAWTTLTLAAFVVSVLVNTWTLSLALVAAIPIALVLMHIPILTFGIVFIRRENNLRLNSIVLMLTMTGASLYFARSTSWVRFAAWQFLAVLAINGIAALAALLLQGAMTRTEAAVGGIKSES